jgi:MFS family permease
MQGAHLHMHLSEASRPEKKHSHLVYVVYLLAFLFSLHVALPVYIDSSYFGLFGSEVQISAIYTLQAVANIVGALTVYPLIRKYGNYRVTKWLIFGQLICASGLIISRDITLLGVSFIINGMLLNSSYIGLDIFVESISRMHSVGKIRGFFYTFSNLAWLLAPTFASSLVDGDEYWRVYIASSVILFPVLFMLRRNFKSFVDPEYPKSNTRTAIGKFYEHRDFKFLSVANVILNLFYTWMVVYVPIHLHKTIGLGWDDIGLILTAMLLPFVILDAPLGKLADSGYGEKKLMVAGFVVMALSVASLSFITTPNVLLWAMALFMTRVGAATAEIMIDTYFFKKIHTRDSDLLSVFRTTRYMAYLIGPFLFTLTARYFDMNGIFIVLGIICLLAIPAIAAIKDKK